MTALPRGSQATAQDALLVMQTAGRVMLLERQRMGALAEGPMGARAVTPSCLRVLFQQATDGQNPPEIEGIFTLVDCERTT